MSRPSEHTDAHFGHGRECLWLFRAAATGIARIEQGAREGRQQREMRRQAEKFSFDTKNPQNTHARKFALKTEEKQFAICCASSYGPAFRRMGVYGNGTTNTDS
jgi:hypothetical protein